MKSCSDLQVDVNGEEIFMVDKKILSSLSGKLSRLFAKVSGPNKNLKVIFHDFPGGARGFELLARYCYNNGRIEMTPSNVVLLNCCARYMEMEGNGSNLVHQTEKSLEGIVFWSWSDLLAALEQSQDSLTTFASSLMLQTILDCLVQRLLFPGLAVHYTSSSDMSSSRRSFDARTSIATATETPPWWFGDLLFLNIDLVDKVVRALLSHKLDHVTITRFLLCYRQSRLLDRLTMEGLIDLLCLLHSNSVSCKALFDLLRVASCLKVSKTHMTKLEELIGPKLDEATVNYLLVPSPSGKRYSYDVNLVLRLVRTFVQERECCAWNKVTWLVDSYIAEVAPDSHLGSSKFVALLTMLPDSARDSHDMLYQSIHMYLQVHPGLCEEKRKIVCSGLNGEKLSAATIEHMAHNSKFPSRSVVRALAAQQMKLRSSIQHLKTSPAQIPDYAKKLYFSSDADKYRAHLQGMQWKVMELEKFCRLLQTHMTNMVKATTRSSSHSHPKLC